MSSEVGRRTAVGIRDCEATGGREAEGESDVLEMLGRPAGKETSPTLSATRRCERKWNNYV